jgi:hypothetical protein
VGAPKYEEQGTTSRHGVGEPAYYHQLHGDGATGVCFPTRTSTQATRQAMYL